MLPRLIDGLTFDALVALVAEGLRESRTLDFKRDRAGTDDKAKKEFLADVSSLANTAGGDLVFGVEEAQGEAVAVPGIVLEDPEKEVLRLESILRSGLEPRLPKVDVQWLPGPDGRGVLIVRTPRSYLGPHRVVYGDHSKFFARSNAGKAAMDVGELRAAFLATEGLHQGIRRFRNERLGIIEAGEGPVGLKAGAKLVLHMLPLEAFAAPKDFSFDSTRDNLPPLGLMSSGFNGRHTLEGYATFSGNEYDPLGTAGYSLLFRSGIVEGVAPVGFSDRDGACIIASAAEWAMLSALGPYREKLSKAGVASPIFVFASLIGVRGHYLALSGRPYEARRPVRGDAVLLPEVEVSNPQVTDEEVIRPICDRLYNAFGFSRSFNFDAAGHYIGDRY